MMKKMLFVGMFFATLMIGPVNGAQALEENLLPLAPMGDDGLYKQSWMPETFLDLKEDFIDATNKGKMLALIWEQKGCPYCKETHLVNFRHPDMVNYIKENFVVLQMNMWGDREVTDFDGEVISEKEYAQKYGILFTPTIQFFPATREEMEGKSGPAMEAFRLPGYFKNFHLKSAFMFVKTGRYKEQNFQRYILERSAENSGASPQ
ncbi:thioredoxin family protein [Magnetospira thiophila]